MFVDFSLLSSSISTRNKHKRLNLKESERNVKSLTHFNFFILHFNGTADGIVRDMMTKMRNELFA